jgi:hypothetical protein
MTHEHPHADELEAEHRHPHEDEHEHGTTAADFAASWPRSSDTAMTPRTRSTKP